MALALPWRLPLLASLALLAVCGAGCTWDWDKFVDPAPVGPTGSFTLTFRDECEGSTVDGARWNTTFVAPNRTTTFRRYDWTSEWVVDENVSLAGGHCRIKLENVPRGDGQYSSGVLNSANKFEQHLGYFEVRARVPRGNGFLSRATLTDPERWPPEMDIMAVRGWEPGHVLWGMFYEEPGMTVAQSTNLTYEGSDLTTDFHVYGLDWRADALVFYVDGVERGRISKGVATLTRPMRLQLVAHIGHTSLQKPDATTPWPSYYDIDYVRVWRRD